MIFILLGIALILLIVLSLHRERLDRYRKSSGGIRNHDSQLREFHYRTGLPAEEVRERLIMMQNEFWQQLAEAEPVPYDD